MLYVYTYAMMMMMVITSRCSKTILDDSDGYVISDAIYLYHTYGRLNLW